MYVKSLTFWEICFLSKSYIILYFCKDSISLLKIDTMPTFWLKRLKYKTQFPYCQNYILGNTDTSLQKLLKKI